MSAMKDLLNKLIGKVNASVKTEAQILSPEQRAQARVNIDAADTESIVEVYNAIDQLSEKFEKEQSTFVKVSQGNIAIIDNTTRNDQITMRFDAVENNRVYCGGKNLFDGNICNIAFVSGTSFRNVIVGSAYRGFYVPIKAGESYTVSRNKVSSNRFQVSFTAEIPADGVELIQSITVPDSNALYVTVNAPESAKYLAVYLSNKGEDLSDTHFQVEFGSQCTPFAEYCGYLLTTSENVIMSNGGNVSTVCWCDSGDIEASARMTVHDLAINDLRPSASNTGNFSIVCAKEKAYNDGTPPKVEYYLLEECGTQRFYLSRNFDDRQYVFTFTGEMGSECYSFGITNNGDIIAFALSSALESGKDDLHRKNPYCWLREEMWSIQHEIEFGDSLKPCGWLSNCGFRNLPNGEVIFCEYTRTTVATANVWKLSGNPSVADSYKIVKQFEVTTNDNQTGFKHIHTVQYDHFTGVVYFSTGDDNANSMVWYSTDGGDNWVESGIRSQKICRNLNYIFTKDYVYFCPDSSDIDCRYVLRAVRGTNGVLDFANIEDYINLYDGSEGECPACYGLAYLSAFNALLVLDRYDGINDELTLNIIDLNNDSVTCLTKLTAPIADVHIGFRTRYTEWYPVNYSVHFGFAFTDIGTSSVNTFAGFGNSALRITGKGMYNINNLVFRIHKIDGVFSLTIDTYY